MKIFNAILFCFLLRCVQITPVSLWGKRKVQPPKSHRNFSRFTFKDAHLGKVLLTSLHPFTSLAILICLCVLRIIVLLQDKIWPSWSSWKIVLVLFMSCGWKNDHPRTTMFDGQYKLFLVIYCVCFAKHGNVYDDYTSLPLCH